MATRVQSALPATSNEISRDELPPFHSYGHGRYMISLINGHGFYLKEHGEEKVPYIELRADSYHKYDDCRICKYFVGFDVITIGCGPDETAFKTCKVAMWYHRARADVDYTQYGFEKIGRFWVQKSNEIAKKDAQDILYYGK